MAVENGAKTFRKIGAWSILSAMIVPLLTWGASRIIDYGERISKLETAEFYMIKKIDEMHRDIKSDIGELKSDVKHLRTIYTSRKK